MTARELFPPKIASMRLLLLFVLALATTSTLPGAAAPSGKQAPPRHTCPQGERSALSELGCELARQLELTDRTLVAAAPLRSDVTLERADEFGERLVRVMGGALGSGLHIHPAPVTLPAARRLAAQSGRLLYLTPELRQGRILLTADVYIQPRAFWDRVKTPVSGPIQHAFAERPADGEIRSFLPRAPIVVSRRDSAVLPDRPALALACGELLPGQGDQIALVGRRRITMGRLRSGKLESSAEREWQDLSPVAPAPLRAPLASARLRGGWLDVGSSDRQQALRLGADLEPLARAPQGLPWPEGGCAPLTPVAASTALVTCLGDASEPSLVELTKSRTSGADTVDAFAAIQLVRANGSSTRVSAFRPAGARSAWLVDDEGRATEVPAVGAQLALGDLDGDGRVELISSRPVLDPKLDTLRVETWHPDGSLTTRYELPMPEVHALAVCPWRGEGLAPLVAAAANRVWVLQ